MKEIRLCDSTDLQAVSELCKANHLGIEVQSFFDPYLEHFEDVLQAHKKILEGMDCGKSLHAPFWDLNLGTKMKGLRRETFETFQYAYRIAKELGCTEVIVHNGYIPGSYGYGGWVERAVRFWQEFFKNKDDSITICIENQFEEDSEIMKLEIDALNDPRLKICLDVGHAHANSNQPAGEWIDSLGERIGYLHLHNNHGPQYIKGKNKDEHLGLTNGTIDMRDILRTAQRRCPRAIWSLEAAVPEIEGSLLFLRENQYL